MGFIVGLLVLGFFFVVGGVLVYKCIERASKCRLNGAWWQIGIALVLVSIVLGFISAIEGLGPSLLVIAVATMPLMRLASLLRRKTDTGIGLAYGVLLFWMAPLCAIAFITASLCAVASVCHHFNLFPS